MAHNNARLLNAREDMLVDLLEKTSDLRKRLDTVISAINSRRREVSGSGSSAPKRSPRARMEVDEVPVVPLDQNGQRVLADDTDLRARISHVSKFCTPAELNIIFGLVNQMGNYTMRIQSFSTSREVGTWITSLGDTREDLNRFLSEIETMNRPAARPGQKRGQVEHDMGMVLDDSLTSDVISMMFSELRIRRSRD